MPIDLIISFEIIIKSNNYKKDAHKMIKEKRERIAAIISHIFTHITIYLYTHGRCCLFTVSKTVNF